MHPNELLTKFGLHAFIRDDGLLELKTGAGQSFVYSAPIFVELVLPDKTVLAARLASPGKGEIRIGGRLLTIEAEPLPAVS
jgi:hypothetical protein